MTSWPHFSEKELACKCCDEINMDARFMESLELLREHLGFSLPVTSGYRCEKHNQRVGGSESSAHLVGKAVDIRIHGEKAWTLLRAAGQFGMKGIGLKQKGPIATRFIHLDSSDFGQRPWVWTY